MAIQGVRYCKVLSIDDSTGSDLIRVRLESEDDGIEDNKLPYAFPLLPKVFHVKPRVGEGVLVLLAVADKEVSQRYYIGPVISQDQFLWYNEFQGATFMRGTEIKPGAAQAGKKECNGIVPNDEDVCVRGRKNADIQLTDDDVRVKSGVKVVDEGDKKVMSFNKQDPAYVKVKYHPGGLFTQEDIEKMDDGEIKQVCGTVTLVGDKINLIQNQKDGFVTTDETDLITDDELKRVMKEAYKLPYGEKLVEILTVFINAFLKHTHKFAMKVPTENDEIKELNNKKATLLDNKELLSDTVRIN